MPVLRCIICGHETQFDCGALEWNSEGDRAYASWEGKCSNPDCRLIMKVDFEDIYDQTGMGEVSPNVVCSGCTIEGSCARPKPQSEREPG